jgi:hypothetical protein
MAKSAPPELGRLKLVPVPQEIPAAVGNLFMIAGMAESALAFHVLRMLAHPKSIDPTAFHLVSGMEVKVKLSIIRTLAALKAPSHKKIIGKACDAIRDAFDKRNEFAHCVVIPGVEPETIVTHSLKATALGTFRGDVKYSIKDVGRFAADILTSARALDEALIHSGFRKVKELPLQDLRKPSRSGYRRRKTPPNA